MKLLSIALDSIDSLHYGCTTHFSAILLQSLSGRVELADLPLLVRLNPGIPWKTRGNGAVVLRLFYQGEPWDLVELAYNLALEYSSGKEDVGIVAYQGEPWDVERLRWLYVRGLTGVLTRDVVLNVLGKLGGLHVGGRGVVGAAASLAALGPADDFTFELIAYRRPELWDSERCFNTIKALESEAMMPPCTFYNVNLLTGEFMASPGGGDPVLAGFRGDCIEHLFKYSKALCEKPHFWAVFRSNQHTDAHAIELVELAPYDTGVLEARILEEPNVIEGGHVVVKTTTKLGIMDLVFYREVEPLNSISKLLRAGDKVRVLGSIRPYKPRGIVTMAVEKMWIEEIERLSMEVNPRCPRCGSRLKSSGFQKGFKCDKCGLKTTDLSKVRVEVNRALIPGEYASGRPRHLTAPPGRSVFDGIRLPFSLRVEDVVFQGDGLRPSRALVELESSLVKKRGASWNPSASSGAHRFV